MNFDEKLKRLSALVERMESGGQSLDEMIASFEEGRSLVADCRSDLESIRLRIEKVTGRGDLEEFKA